MHVMMAAYDATLGDTVLELLHLLYISLAVRRSSLSLHALPLMTTVFSSVEKRSLRTVEMFSQSAGFQDAWTPLLW